MRYYKLYTCIFFLISWIGYFSLTSRPSKIKSVNTIKGLPPLPKALQEVEARRAPQVARYKAIKIDAEKAFDEIKFWAHQLSEHALIFHLGIEEKALKEEGLTLHKKFEDFRKRMNTKNLAEILPLTEQLRDYKIRVLTNLLNGKWLGWIFPVFARHVIVELDYFVDKLNGVSYSPEEEATFWDVINGEHAGLASHLLDPTERKVVDETNEFSLLFEKIAQSEEEMLVKLSLKAAQELDEYYKDSEGKIKKGAVKSVIHPALIDHDIREGERAIEILKRLAK